MIGEQRRSLDEQIAAIVREAVADASERAARSKEVMNREEAREYLGLTKDEFKKRRWIIPCRRESERKVYYLRDDLIAYLKSLPREPEQSDYFSDYPPHHEAPRDTFGSSMSA